MQFYNVHTHVFTMNNAPKEFLSLYMPKIAATAVDKITNTQVGAFIVRKLLQSLGGPGGKRYATFLKIGKSKNQNDVLRHLLGEYEDSSMKMIALTLNMERIGAGASLTGFEGQLEEIITLKKRYPDRLLVFLSIDPRWKATGEEIRDKVAAYFDKKVMVNETRSVHAFAGLKLYPSTGYYAFDQKLMPVMKWAAEHKVPIMTHCSYLGGVFNNDTNYVKVSLNPYDPYAQAYYKEPRYQVVKKKHRENNLTSCSYYLEPYSYESMIKYFADKGTPLKICFAHFGGDKHMLNEHVQHKGDQYYGVQPTKNWTKQILELIENYEGVYTDISYSLANEQTHDFVIDRLKDPRHRDRLLFGTDFFMTEREQPEHQTYGKFKTRALNEQTDDINAWERIAMKNAEAYLTSSYYKPGND